MWRPLAAIRGTFRSYRIYAFSDAIDALIGRATEGDSSRCAALLGFGRPLPHVMTHTRSLIIIFGHVLGTLQ
jgi:hypothetical protein